jgi:hypothetical protein
LKSAIEKGMNGSSMSAKADQKLFLFPKQREEKATEHNQHKLSKGDILFLAYIFKTIPTKTYKRGIVIFSIHF